MTVFQKNLFMITPTCLQLPAILWYMGIDGYGWNGLSNDQLRSVMHSPSERLSPKENNMSSVH